MELSETDALFDNPLHPYTQALLAAIPIPSPANRQPKALLQGDVPSPAAPPSGCRFHTRCPHARPVCKEQHPALETAPGGRQVACHFWREIQGAGAGSISAPPPSPALAKRLELYRTWRERQDKPVATSP
jgi:oligopeptide/dipeptide ABC transporter ATP-binding protein